MLFCLLVRYMNFNPGHGCRRRYAIFNFPLDFDRSGPNSLYITYIIYSPRVQSLARIGCVFDFQSDIFQFPGADTLGIYLILLTRLICEF